MITRDELGAEMKNALAAFSGKQSQYPKLTEVEGKCSAEQKSGVDPSPSSVIESVKAI